MKDGVNRRSFLRSTAVTGAGLAFAPSLFAAQAKPADDDINIAVIGAGTQGRRLLDSYQHMPGINIKAICDIWKYNRDILVNRIRKYAKRYPKKYAVNAYKDYQQMLDNEKNLDAVIIATPDFCHEEQTIACLKAGLDVYCEKPIASTIEAARNMVKVHKQTGKLLQIGHQRRSNPKYIYCKNTLMDREKLIGRITAVNAQWNQSIRPDMFAPKGKELAPAVLKQYGYRDMRSFMNWRWYKKLSGGPVADLASHQIDVFNWFLNANPIAVTASGGTDYYDKNTHQCHDTVMAVLEYETKHGKVRASHQTITTNGFNNHFETIMGIDGSINISELNKGGIYPERYVEYEIVKRWNKYLVMGNNILVAPVKEYDIDDSINRFTTVEKFDEEHEMFWGWRVSESPPPPRFEVPRFRFPKYGIPTMINEPPHAPHLRNFFDAIRGKAKLNCPADKAYACAVAVNKVNQAIELRKTLTFDPKEFTV